MTWVSVFGLYLGWQVALSAVSVGSRAIVRCSTQPRLNLHLVRACVVLACLNPLLAAYLVPNNPLTTWQHTFEPVASGLTSVPVLFVLAIVLWGLVSGVFPPAMQVRVLRLASARFRTTAGGVVVATFNLGVAAGAALGGVVVGSGVDRLAPVALAVTAVGAVALVLLARTAPEPSA